MNRRGLFLIGAVLGLTGSHVWLTSGVPARGSAVVAASQSTSSQSETGDGQTTTRLADGRWLVVGGAGAERRASLWDPQTRTAVPTVGSPSVPRTGHSATLLSDGTVLLIGGKQADALVDAPEIFDPVTETFTLTAIVGAVPRASHTATLLTDGRVLVVGGSNGSATPLPTEVWDVADHTATTVGSGGVDRFRHDATLLADGRVLVSAGRATDGSRSTDTLAVDPLRGTVQRTTNLLEPIAAERVAASIPVAGQDDVPLDAHLTVRFSDAIAADSLNNTTLALHSTDGPVAAKVIAAEGGRLAFVWPESELSEGTTYVLKVSGLVNRFGVPVLSTSIPFRTTARKKDTAPTVDGEDWVPDLRTPDGGRMNQPPSPWESLAPLVAPSGVTAISGRVLTLNGQPLPDVTLAIEGKETTRSDRTGRFLLKAPSLGAGRYVLQIAGASASRAGRKYGFFEYGMNVVPGKTTVLPFTIWMPKLDLRHVVTIPSPTRREVVVTTPYIPGLELHIPPQTVLRGEDGRPVTEVGITPIPVDRPPFPLATNVVVPVYFTIQPGSTYVYTTGTGLKGAQLVYPNYRGGEPGQRVQFFHYDPDEKDWYVYGLGKVTQNGAQVVPDPTTRIYEFTGAMINSGNSPPGYGGTPEGPPKGDPVDPSTGVFLMHKTDLYLPDVIPLALTRTYNSGDTLARPFGRGMTHPYAMFLWSANQFQEADLILPEGGKIHYVRTSPGTTYWTAVFSHQESATTSATPTEFYKSVLAWNGTGWDLTLKNGTVYVFPMQAPLQMIRDRYGNTVTITTVSGKVTRVTSQNGRWIGFTYDTSNRITSATDNIGRTVSYTYDSNGNLSTVTDPENGVTTYTYVSNRLATIRDGRNIVYLTNTYTNGRVTSQTLADTNTTYQFSYTVDGSGNITQTDVTDPRGNVERLAFNSDHYIISDTQAYGTSLARTTTTTRQTGSNLVTAVVDGLSRRTEYTYDSSGHILNTTRLAGTSDAVTTSFTYEPVFFQLATFTDPLNHTWTLGYGQTGKLTSVSDPLSHQSTVTMNALGQVTQVVDALQHAWQFGYAGGDAISITNPLNQTATQFVDAGGRVVRRSDPLGGVTRSVFDKLNRITAITDPQGGQTSFTYDQNSNLLSLTDALTHVTSYTYDNFDRVATRTDPLTHTATYQYDGNDNVTQATDRMTQVMGSGFDALDRLTQVTFNDSSTISYTYDAGDRITQIIDSLNGTIARTYDGLDRLTEETTPEGTVDYTYDAAGRRVSMTVVGQTAVSYDYDNANRLTSITQGTSTLALTYDNANRRSTLTFPNGIVATFGYDNANRLTTLAYVLSGNSLGSLAYGYDAAGHRTTMSGSWARKGLPAALASATYDAANRIATWGGTSFTYDLNGNLTNDGTTTYAWNARDQLAAISGGVSASFGYDGTGRRRAKTVGSATTNFLYDGLNVVQELSGGAPTATLLTGLGIDETFTRTDGNGAHALLFDALGSTLALADVTGVVQTTYTYDPFGATATSGSTSPNSAQFTRRENDGTGLYFYRNRFYHPALQRFINGDPLGLSAGANLYVYVSNRPTMVGDPLGLDPQSLDPVTWWYWFLKVLGSEVPASVDAAEAMHKLEEGQKILEKGVENAEWHVQRRSDTIKEICTTSPDWPFCKKDDPNKPDPPKKKTKSDDREPDL
jgi:RHS repeat-associated protein